MKRELIVKTALEAAVLLERSYWTKVERLDATRVAGELRQLIETSFETSAEVQAIDPDPAPFGICPKCKQPITSFHNINGCPAEKTAAQLRGIPILIVEDPKMPPDQIELHSPNGQIVRVVNIK